MSLIVQTKNGYSVKLTKQYKVGIILTKDFEGDPSKASSE